MDRLEAQMKQMKKLQKRGKKQAARLNKLARQQMKELDFSASLDKLSGDMLPKVKKLPFSTRCKNRCRQFGILAILLAIAGGLAFLGYRIRRSKQERQNLPYDSRFELIDGLDDDAAHDFDFGKASLEELEEALLQVENRLGAVNDSLNTSEK